MFYAEQSSLGTFRTVVRQPVATDSVPVKEVTASKSMGSNEDIVGFSNWAALPKWKRALDISLIFLAAPLWVDGVTSFDLDARSRDETIRLIRSRRGKQPMKVDVVRVTTWAS